uniref:Putative G patch domain-containing protein 1 n=1 Tax=Davidia involucrata TaxID=16924 RepID=A0A5B7CE04_DAVIN
MDSDEEDYVFYGTPIERAEEITSRKKKAVAEASGHLRTLPPWKQEVTDEEGRRRFHGAFTGGFSAGYYNTVGSKEGWTPQTFTSSRKNRAEFKQQNILNFLDDDEKADMEGHSLGTSMQFDTFGFTAAELARKQAEKEQQQRPSAIPGPVPDEIVLPATDSIGVKLLLKMGWRHGHSITDSRPNSLYDARREARKAFLALSSDDAAVQLASFEPLNGDLENVMELPTDDNRFSQSTPVYVLNPKQDLHGLGYDPFKHAPEFREKKRSRLSGNRELGHEKPFSMKNNLFAFKSERIAPGFGIGALEELDAEDENVYASGYDFEETYVQEIEEPSNLIMDNKKRLGGKEHGVLPRLGGNEHGVLPGFKVASNSDYQLERFDPPVIPKDFVPHHKFLAPLDIDNKLADAPPPEIPPPEDNNLKILIEGVATLVARCGKLFEDLSREKNQSNPLFSFLNGGKGHDYYSRKLWEERQKRNDQTKQQWDGKMLPSVQKMTAESRGKILGEKPLERSPGDVSSSVNSTDSVQLQLNLSDTFTKPASFSEHSEIAKPFLDDPAKQGRFEQFLKEKYQGGLRSKDSGGASNMSESARARERLEFEAAAEAIGKGKWEKESKLPNLQFMQISATPGLQFTSSGLGEAKVTQAEELIMKKMYPKREEYQWRPSSILCKRFDIMDPYLGKPPPAPRVRSKMDSLIFTSDSVKATKVEETVIANRDPLPVPQPGVEEISREVTEREIEVEVEVENVERPVDLYKAIFSDDSDDEEENSSLNQVEGPQKKVEAANTTLSRLIAGDFLESLGKELGLEVPPDLPYSETKAKMPTVHKESVNASKGDTDTLPVENKPSFTLHAVSGTSINQEDLQGRPHDLQIGVECGSHTHKFIDGNSRRSGSKITGTGSSEKKSGKVEPGKVDQEDTKDGTPSGRRRRWSNSSSEDERSSKRSRHRRHRSSNSYSDTTDSSDDYRDRHHSSSKGRKKGSSREKSSSRKHSKHHKHRIRDSPSRSSRHGTEKEHTEAKREKRR